MLFIIDSRIVISRRRYCAVSSARKLKHRQCSNESSCTRRMDIKKTDLKTFM